MSAIKDLIDQLDKTDIYGIPKIFVEDTFGNASKEMTAALDSVIDERARQDAKWGEQNHNPFIYYAIVGEEFGELAEAILQTDFGGPKGGLINLRKEAVHTAASALALIECLDRAKYHKISRGLAVEGG